jgi:hypothetical protein
VKPDKEIALPALWRSLAEEKNLSLDAHLRLAWKIERVISNYQLLPRLDDAQSG